jgi:hypothetical protein
MNRRSSVRIDRLLVLFGLVALGCGGRARETSDSPSVGVASNGGADSAWNSGDASGGLAGTTGVGGLGAPAGTGAGGGASGSEGGTGGLEGPVPCNNPSQVFSGGIVTCQSGPTQHRVSPEMCTSPSGCRNDTDCAPDELCLCDLVMNSCIKTACHADAECGPGLLCALGFPDGYVCQTFDDECTTTCPPDRGTCVVEQKPDGAYWRACRVLEGSGGSGPL